MSDARLGDPREYGDRDRDDEPPRVYDRDREDYDPRDALMHDLDLPRGDERELVVHRDRVYDLNGEDSRTLAAIGTFRVVPEEDLDADHDTLGHLRDEGLVETVDLGSDERGVVLTKEGRDLLDSHTLEREAGVPQAFHAGVSRPREIDHDSNLYATYRQKEARLREEPGDLEVRRVIFEEDLKRGYQGVPAGPQPVRQRRTTRSRRGRDTRLGARARLTVLRWPGALPGLPHRVRG